MTPSTQTPAFDPANLAPALLTWWRMAMFDMPLAYAAETNAFMERWIAHQAEYFERLAGSTTLEEMVEAQSVFVGRSVEDYAQGARSISRDIGIEVEAASG